MNSNHNNATPQTVAKRFRFGLRALFFATTYCCCVLALFHLWDGYQLILPLTTLAMVWFTLAQRSSRWKSALWSYVSLAGVFCTAQIQLASANQWWIAGIRMPGPPPRAVSLLLLTTAVFLFASSIAIASRNLWNGPLAQRLLAFFPVLVFALFIGLMISTPLCFQSRAIVSTTRAALRGWTNGTAFVGSMWSGYTEMTYRDGLRDGIWREWDRNGNLVCVCEYREGRPWEGVCKIYDGKGFRGVYRQGEHLEW